MSDLLYFCTQVPVALQSLQGHYADWLEDAKVKFRTMTRFPRQSSGFRSLCQKEGGRHSFRVASRITRNGS